MKKEDATRVNQSNLRSISYFTLFRFASKWDKILIGVALFGTFISGISLPYAITLVANVFQNMINYAKSNKNNLVNDKFLHEMHLFSLKYTGVGVILLMGGYLGTALMNIAAINQVLKIRQEYIKAALNQDFAYYDLHQTGDFASKMAE
ncbi:ATP-dependent translocase ABCB1-like [Colias croceus]|uniref:ATP-dependent translocase ABCB1-like n=1 Tax=Colias crocea TaxID=72248 RepID=UPI001E27ECB3|nr:ATP-dependent translocase ABCB1-like [Colias croceus]